MLGLLNMTTKLTLPILLINKLILLRSLKFEVVFLKTIEPALSRLLHGAIQFIWKQHQIDIFSIGVIAH